MVQTAWERSDPPSSFNPACSFDKYRSGRLAFSGLNDWLAMNLGLAMIFFRLWFRLLKKSGQAAWSVTSRHRPTTPHLPYGPQALVVLLHTGIQICFARGYKPICFAIHRHFLWIVLDSTDRITRKPNWSGYLPRLISDIKVDYCREMPKYEHIHRSMKPA